MFLISAWGDVGVVWAHGDGCRARPRAHTLRLHLFHKSKCFHHPLSLPVYQSLVCVCLFVLIKLSKNFIWLNDKFIQFILVTVKDFPNNVAQETWRLMLQINHVLFFGFFMNSSYRLKKIKLNTEMFYFLFESLLIFKLGT